MLMFRQFWTLPVCHWIGKLNNFPLSRSLLRGLASTDSNPPTPTDHYNTDHESLSEATTKPPSRTEERFYGYAKRLEFKNRSKEGKDVTEQLRKRIYRMSLTTEQSVLVMDLLRKHKAMRRDLKRMRRMVRKSPEAATHAMSFKPKPFGHCEPTTTQVVSSLVDKIHHIREREEELELVKERGTALVRIPQTEVESVGSLEGLQLGAGGGVAQPPRPSRIAPFFKLPLSRPNLASFLRVKPETMDLFDAHFAEWFIGMTEAQTPFKFTSSGRPFFALEHLDVQLFRRIRAHLHFGHVDDVKQLWYVIDDENLPRLIHLLNGNLYLESTRQAFQDWVQKYCALGTWKAGDSFKVMESCSWRPQLNNKWLMGFIDSSRGMFAGRLVESQLYPYFRINLKFWILHHDRGLLEYVQQIFGGGEIDRDGDSFRWSIKERKHHRKVNMYCRMFRPMSLKNVSAVRYDRLVHYPFVKVKTSTAWTKLKTLVESLNKFERKYALAMSFHPYHGRYREITKRAMELARTGTQATELKVYTRDEQQKRFPLWETPKYLSLIKEVD